MAPAGRWVNLDERTGKVVGRGGQTNGNTSCVTSKPIAR